MEGIIKTPQGTAAFANNPQWGDKLEIAFRIHDLDDRLKKIQNLWWRAAEYDKQHKELYSETLDEVVRLAAFTSGIGADLHVYILEKVKKWEREENEAE